MVNKSIFVANKLITGLWWILLFGLLLVVTFIGTGVEIFTLHTSLSSNPLMIAIGGLSGVVFTILGILLFAIVLRGIGWFFHTGLPYNTYLRISVIYILLRLFLGIMPLPFDWLHTCLLEALSTIYLSIAIWAAVPAVRRTPTMLLIGVIPGIFTLAFLFVTGQVA